MTSSSSRWKIAAALAIVYVVWGSTFMAIRIGVQTMPPFFLAGSRFLLAGIILFLYACVTSAERPTLWHWRSAAIIGFLLLVSGNAVVVWGEQHISSGLAALLISTVPIWMVCLPVVMSRAQRPTGRIITGLMVGFIGVVILIPPWTSGASAHESLVCLALLGASLSWAIGTLYAKSAPLPKSSHLAASLEMVCGGFILLVLSYLTGEWNHIQQYPIAAAAWKGLVYLVLFGSVIAFSAYQWLTKKISTAQLSTYAYVNPVVAVFLGWAFLGETITFRLLCGALVILGGVILISWPTSK